MNRRCLLSRAIVPIFCSAVLLACNTDSETPDSSPDLAARSNPDAVSFFLRRWKLADADAVGVSAFPLPVGSDPDGWTLMQQGYRAHAAAARRRGGARLPMVWAHPPCSTMVFCLRAATT